jgi:signal transduction histidine kinase
MELGVAEDATTARFVDYSRGAGLPSDALDSLLEDERGRLWISSDRGISRLDPATGQFRNFDATDGALPRGYMIHAAARLESGQFAFGGSDGFTVFDPETIVDAPPPPRPLLTQLTLGNRPVGLRPLDATSPLDVPLHLTSRLRLPWAQARSVGLGFSVPEFAQAERLSFLYQLEGFDPDWITTDSGQRSIAYTNLEPGGYRFRLRVVDPDGTSSSEEAGLAITVVAPWWITAWAQAAYALSIALLVLGAHKLRLRRVKGQRRTLQLEVGLRTAELKATNGVLSETLEELTRTQKTLVEQEKMASLGQLVAGVAHEINTPLGVAVTASSMLRGRTDELCAQFEQGGLRGSDLTDYLHLARQATAMVDSNLARAAHLVHSFKQVSVDRASDDRRRFDLGSYLQALVSSLEPACNPRAIRLVLTCADGIGVESYPGTLGQIITNFVQNALLHAYAEAQPGTLSLNVHRMGEREIVMVFADDGRGISASALPHVFEPFYTTRRGQGGTGLGLHVVYNLVSVRLGGQIEVSSELGRGTMFTVRFPQLAPKT